MAVDFQSIISVEEIKRTEHRVDIMYINNRYGACVHESVYLFMHIFSFKKCMYFNYKVK